jgi:hypothetical protein
VTTEDKDQNPKRTDIIGGVFMAVAMSIIILSMLALLTAVLFPALVNNLFINR